MTKKKSFILIGIGILFIVVIIFAWSGFRFFSKPIDKNAVIQKIDTSRYFSEEEINQAVDVVIQDINSINQSKGNNGFNGYVDLLEIIFDGREIKEGIRLITTISDDGNEMDWSWDLKKTDTGWIIENYGAG